MRVNRSLGWRLLNSWWVLLPLLLGFAAWAAFLYAGLRGKKRLWVIFAAVYFVAFLPAYLVPHNAWPEDAEGGFLIAFMTVSFIHAIIIRNSYLVRRQLLQECGPLTEGELDDEIARRILQVKDARAESILHESEQRNAAIWDQELKRSEGRADKPGAPPSSRHHTELDSGSEDDSSKEFLD